MWLDKSSLALQYKDLHLPETICITKTSLRQKTLDWIANPSSPFTKHIVTTYALCALAASSCTLVQHFKQYCR
jgi:hypothetical protein